VVLVSEDVAGSSKGVIEFDLVATDAFNWKGR